MRAGGGDQAANGVITVAGRAAAAVVNAEQLTDGVVLVAACLAGFACQRLLGDTKLIAECTSRNQLN
jgi:hypothetical protein